MGSVVSLIAILIDKGIGFDRVEPDSLFGAKVKEPLYGHVVDDNCQPLW